MTTETAAVLPFTSKPVASFVVVTPDTARRWLDQNGPNRKISQRTLNSYKRDMLAGRWHMDGSPIRFTGDGQLLDGQHRLLAIAETGVTLTLLVVRGVAPEAQAVMDSGRKRSASDALSIHGYSNYVNLAAAARFATLVEAGKIADSTAGYDVSHEEILSYLTRNPDLESAVAFMSSYIRKTDCRPAVVSYTYFVFRRIDEQAAAEFWVGVAEKAGLQKGDPALVLGNRLAEARRSRESMSNRALLSMIYRCWNARREGRSLTFIRINLPGDRLVPIPKPH